MANRYVMRIRGPQDGSQILSLEPGSMVVSPTAVGLGASRRLALDSAGLEVTATDVGLTVPSGVPWPELPSGWTVVRELDFEDKADGSTNYTPLLSKSNNGTRTITHQDIPTALIDASELGQDTALVFNYPANHSSGGGIELYATLPSGTGEAFVSFNAFISDNFVSGPGGINKYMYFGGTNPIGGVSILWIEFTGSAPYAATVIDQRYQQSGLGSDASPTPSPSDRINAPGVIPRGEWHRIAVRYKMPSTLGANDGELEYWVDGTRVIVTTTMTGAGIAQYDLDNITISGILGGTGGMTNPAQAWAIDSLIIAVPPI